MMPAISVGVVLVVAVLLVVSCARSTPAIRDDHSGMAVDSIAEMVRTNIRGYEQHLLIRGLDRNAPVLLFLHGGPGASELPLVRKWNSDLENHFVLVQWEQPGAGISYRRGYSPGFIDGETLVECGVEITEYLKNRFGRQKIYLLGHCMGSIIGVEMIRQKPDDFAAYVGVTQHVNLRRNLSASYEELSRFYESCGNETALAELKEVAAIFLREEPVNYFSPEVQGQASVYNRWLERSGGLFNGETGLPRRYRNAFLHSREFSVRDVLNASKGPALMRPIAETWIDLDYAVECPKLEVPVWFVMGANDKHVISEVTKGWFDILDAPTKTFLEFENSAHFPLFEESDRFNQTMLEVLEACELNAETRN